VIELCEEVGIPIRVGDFTLLDVYAADEAFVTGTFGGVTPVRSIDGRAFEAPGAVTEVLRREYAELVRRR
jgi:branched-chain amino acid aminotransferase